MAALRRKRPSGSKGCCYGKGGVASHSKTAEFVESVQRAHGRPSPMQVLAKRASSHRATCTLHTFLRRWRLSTPLGAVHALGCPRRRPRGRRKAVKVVRTLVYRPLGKQNGHRSAI